jgi:hypothetical protein
MKGDTEEYSVEKEEENIVLNTERTKRHLAAAEPAAVASGLINVRVD